MPGPLGQPPPGEGACLARAGPDYFRLAGELFGRHALTPSMKLLEQDSARPDMDRLTGIDPVHAADMTLFELRSWFREEFPADFEAKLVRRMELAFARHARWRNHAIRAEEPDFVRTFFRRWLAELLFKERRDLFRRLPPDYRYGEPIWPKPEVGRKPRTKPATVKPEPEPVTVTVERVEVMGPVRKPVRLSLPLVHGAELLLA